MKIHLVSGGCGFVGRNMVKRLYQTTNDTILFIDNLSTGEPPATWLGVEQVGKNEDMVIFGTDERLLFLKNNFRDWLAAMTTNPQYLQEKYGLKVEQFSDVFHFATLEDSLQLKTNLIKVGLNVAIDAAFFYWVSQQQPKRVLYTSTNDIYATSTPSNEEVTGLNDSTIDFNNFQTPDSIFDQSKLTGEYLARITAQNYDISIACIRPFVTYGGDQNLSSPIPAIAARIVRQETPLVIKGANQQHWDFVHIEDVLDGILEAIDAIKDGSTINIGNGKLTSLMEIVHTLCDLADYEPTIQQTLEKSPTRTTPPANLEVTQEKLDWTPKISIEEGLIDVYQTALQRERAAEVV